MKRKPSEFIRGLEVARRYAQRQMWYWKNYAKGSPMGSPGYTSYLATSDGCRIVFDEISARIRREQRKAKRDR